MLFCRVCGLYAQWRIEGLAAPCAGLKAHGQYRLRRDRLPQGQHPVTRQPLAEVGRSWLGRLADDALLFDAGGVEHPSWQRAPSRDEQALAKHSYRFLDGQMPESERALDSFLRALAEQVQATGPPAPKMSAPSADED